MPASTHEKQTCDRCGRDVWPYRRPPIIILETGEEVCQYCVTGLLFKRTELNVRACEE